MVSSANITSNEILCLAMIKDLYWQILEKKLFSRYICTLRLTLDIIYLYSTQYVKFHCDRSVHKIDTNTIDHFHTLMLLHRREL